MRRRIRVARGLGEGHEPPRGTVDDDAAGFLTELTRFVLVALTDTEAFQYAAALLMKDFEDATQVAAARSCGADVIVTRNLKDYQHAPLSALTPKQVLASLL
jgi:predicted nucleic acid-binding protein